MNSFKMVADPTSLWGESSGPPVDGATELSRASRLGKAIPSRATSKVPHIHLPWHLLQF